MRYSEEVAKVVIESLLPGFRMQYHADQHDGPPDFDLHSLNGLRRGIVEVTKSVDRPWLETYEAIKRKRSIPAQKCRKNWVVHLMVNPNLKDTGGFDDALAVLEENGWSQFPIQCDDWRATERVYDTMQGLKIGVAWAFDPSDGKPRISFLSPGRGGSVSYEAFECAIATEANKPDNLRKLSLGGHPERHLFVLLTPLNILPWRLVIRSIPSKGVNHPRDMVSSPPRGTTSIPREITHVWAAAIADSGDEAVVWRAENGSGWENLGSVAIPIRPLDGD